VAEEIDVGLSWSATLAARRIEASTPRYFYSCRVNDR